MIHLKSYSLIQIQGEKAQAFLQGQLTCDMRLLSTHGKNGLAAICDPSGRMIANFWVVNFKGDFKLILPSNMTQIVINHLKKYAVFSKVLVEHDSDHLNIFSLDEPHNSSSIKNSLSVQIPNSSRSLLLTTDFSLTTSDNENIFKEKNIQDQISILYPETSLLFIPQMINLEKLGGVSFEKGCYVGQEIIARTQHLGKLKRHLHYLELLQDTVPKPGDALKNLADETIGTFVDAVLTQKNQVKALAVIYDFKQA